MIRTLSLCWDFWMQVSRKERNMILPQQSPLFVTVTCDIVCSDSRSTAHQGCSSWLVWVQEASKKSVALFPSTAKPAGRSLYSELCQAGMLRARLTFPSAEKTKNCHVNRALWNLHTDRKHRVQDAHAPLFGLKKLEHNICWKIALV